MAAWIASEGELTPSGRLWLTPISLFPSGLPSGPHGPNTGCPAAVSQRSGSFRFADPPDVWVGRELRIRVRDRAAPLRYILKVKDGAEATGDGCGGCQAGWQVADFAEERGG
jgi:hypothetical protein